jgi:Icc-related predicted phosphoesterase
MKRLHITALSDSHNSTHGVIIPEIPTGMTTVLIHAGDFSFMGKSAEIQDFIAWMSDQPHDHKLWIPGNHELSLEDFPYNIEVIDNEAGATCIHNKEIEIEGFRFFGSAMTPSYFNWAFMHDKEQAERYWERAPDADIVVCHGPPVGILDTTSPDYPMKRLGCVSFRNYLERTKPKLALWGHIHGGYGHETIKWEDGGETECYNVAVMDENYDIRSEPAVTIEL